MRRNYAAEAKVAIKSGDKEQVRQIVKEINAATDRKRELFRTGKFGL